MKDRRDFVVKSSAGLAAVGLVANADAAAKVEKSEDGYAAGGSIQSSRSIERVKIKVTAPLFCPYHSLSTHEEKGGWSSLL